jgi:hypothetical protein
MERLSKVIVVLSAAVALALMIHLVSRGFPPLFRVTIAAFVAAAALSAVVGDVALSGIAFLTCLSPALFTALTGDATYHFLPWLAALFGFQFPQSIRTAWSLPPSWKAPVILWALCIALSWPIVVARELDFNSGLLYQGRLWTSRGGGTPAFAVAWTVSVVCLTLVGLLWLDWLSARYSSGRRDLFERRVVWPLFAGACISAAAAVYQSFGHVSFLNPTLYGAIGRASGTMLDGNAFGVTTAMWIPPIAALMVGSRSRRPLLSVVWLVVLAGFWIGLWSSGSRTALLAGTVGVAVFVISSRTSWRATMPFLVAGGALAAVLTAVVLSGALSDNVMIRRIQMLVPDLSPRALGMAMNELWARNRYGTAAVRLIADHPLVGVGVGGFHVQVADAAYLNGYSGGLPSDNAQNWFRHQLSELGVLGSVGWAVFCGAFLWMLLRRRAPGGARVMAGAVKGSVTGLGFASLLGMPTQDAAVLFTFLVLVFWFVRLTDSPPVNPAEVPLAIGRRGWMWMGAVLGCFLAGTAYAGWNELRPSFRAMRADWAYQYGFHDPEPDSDLRWTEGRAVSVFPIGDGREDRWFELVLAAVAPDADQRPVEVKVWRDRDLILRLTRRSDTPKTWFVRVPPDRKMMMLRIEVSRTWRPSDYGRSPDQRERGVLMGTWRFRYDAPKGALVIPWPTAEATVAR